MAELRTAIEEEYNRIPLSKINELISTMKKRVDTLFFRFGDATGY
jgi:hypothetical protein